MLLVFSMALPAQEDVKRSTDVSPTIVRDALVNSNRIGRKEYWVIGVEHATRIVEQVYVVMVPGSEGQPSRYEQRTRNVSTPHPIPHRYSVDAITFTDSKGNQIDHDAAAKQIAKTRSFLFVPMGKTVSEADRNIYNPDSVWVTPKLTQ